MSNGERHAFPSPDILNNSGRIIFKGANGLTKMEYFSGLALQALIPSLDMYGDSGNDSIQLMVMHSIEIAGELLKQLEKK